VILSKIIRRSIAKLSRADDVQDGHYISCLLDWCTATETPIGIKLRLLQLLASVKDMVCTVAILFAVVLYQFVLAVCGAIKLKVKLLPCFFFLKFLESLGK